MKRLFVIMILLASPLIIAIGCGEDAGNSALTGTGAENSGIAEHQSLSPESQFRAPLVPFTKYYDVGTVNVQSCFLDTMEHKMTINFIQTMNTGETIEKAFVISRLPEQQLEIGLRTELIDANQNLLWRFDIQVDSNLNNPIHYKYVEATAIDSLEMDIVRVGDTTTEIYSLADEDIGFTYTPEEYEALKESPYISRQAFAKAINPTPSPSISKLEESALRFIQAQQDMPTLYDNADGILLAEMFADEAFISWLHHETNPEAQPLNWTIEGLCGWIGAATTVKCIFGLEANPACVVGQGLSLACAGYMVVSYVYGEFNHSIYNK